VFRAGMLWFLVFCRGRAMRGRRALGISSQQH
jgi:hypothetical protein